jgi:hypothetical protein
MSISKAPLVEIELNEATSRFCFCLLPEPETRFSIPWQPAINDTVTSSDVSRQVFFIMRVAPVPGSKLILVYPVTQIVCGRLKSGLVHPAGAQVPSRNK